MSIKSLAAGAHSFTASFSGSTTREPSESGAVAFKVGTVPVNSLDFNADGKPDIVWRNTANGACYVWYTVNGAFTCTDAFLFSLPPEWVIHGVADSMRMASPTSSSATPPPGSSSSGTSTA